MNPYFTKLAPECSVYDWLVEISKTAEFKFQANVFKTFVPNEVGDQDPTMRMLRVRYGGLYQMYLNDPFTIYRLHKDSTRNCAVNMLLSGFDSASYFMGTRVTDEIYKFERLVYEPKRMYLFNTQQMHGVMNFSERRVLFTLTLKQSVPYLDVVRDCDTLQLIARN